jgi:hypothetical protein
LVSIKHLPQLAPHQFEVLLLHDLFTGIEARQVMGQVFQMGIRCEQPSKI